MPRAPRERVGRIGLAVLIACAGCAEEPAQALKEGLRLAEARARLRPLTAADVADADGLARVLGRPLKIAAPRLGGLRQTLTGRYLLVASGEPQVFLSEVLTVERDATGAYALRHRNTSRTREDPERSDQRACWWVAGRWYTAGTSGLATEVPVLDHEQVRCLEGAVEPLAGLIEILRPHLKVEPKAPQPVAGRSALRIILSRGDRGTQLPAEIPSASPDASVPSDRGRRDPAPPLGRASLLQSHARPLAIKGALSLDVETGALLAGELEATLLLRKAGRDAELQVILRLEADPFTGSVRAPEVHRVYGPRPRIYRDRAALLGEVFKGEAAPDAGTLPLPGEAPPLKVEREEEAPVPDHATPARRRRRRRP